VSTRSPSNFGFALLKTIRMPVANCRSRYGDEGVGAAKKVAPVAPKRHRVVGCEPDRRHLYHPLLPLLVAKTARRSSSWAAMAWRLLWAVRGWLLRDSGQQRPGS